MAGIHLTSRATKPNKYKKVETYLVLPQYVSGDSLVKPEYILGFYGDSYGMDIGICYENGEFQLFYWSLLGTCNPQGEEKRVILDDVSVGDTLKLKAQINSSSISLKVYKGGTYQGSMKAPLTSKAKKDFANGCYINRELVIASNASGKYTPRNVYSYNAKFKSGKLTTVDGDTVDFDDSVSTITRDKTPDDNYLKVSECKYIETITKEDWEEASCDLN